MRGRASVSLLSWHCLRVAESHVLYGLCSLRRVLQETPRMLTTTQNSQRGTIKLADKSEVIIYPF